MSDYYSNLPPELRRLISGFVSSYLDETPEANERAGLFLSLAAPGQADIRAIGQNSVKPALEARLLSYPSGDYSRAFSEHNHIYAVNANGSKP